MLITASIIIIDSIVVEESNLVGVQDIGGRQRMLSERTVHLLLEYAIEENRDKRHHLLALIHKTLNKFDQVHKLLIQGHLPAGNIIYFSDSIDDIFFDKPQYLDFKARIFVYNTREVLSKEWSPELLSSYYLKQLREASKQDLHNSLEALATQYTKNSKSRIDRLRRIVAALLGGIVVVLLAVGAFVFNPMFKRIVTQERELHKLAFIDPLAGCHNRRSFLGNANTAFERSRRYNHRISILFIDIDRFKEINDNYGHATGDKAIAEMTRICQHNIRDSDILGRIGGDEFGIILQECDLSFANHTAEKLRKRVAEHILSHKGNAIKFSISVGAATLIDDDANVYDTLKRADDNLYIAKRSGRNMVIAA